MEERILVRFTPAVESQMADGRTQYLYAIAPIDSIYALGSISVFTMELEKVIEMEVEVSLLDGRKSSGKIAMGREDILTDPKKKQELQNKFSNVIDDCLKVLGLKQYTLTDKFMNGDMP